MFVTAMLIPYYCFDTQDFAVFRRVTDVVICIVIVMFLSGRAYDPTVRVVRGHLLLTEGCGT